MMPQVSSAQGVYCTGFQKINTCKRLFPAERAIRGRRGPFWDLERRNFFPDQPDCLRAKDNYSPDYNDFYPDYNDYYPGLDDYYPDYNDYDTGKSKHGRDLPDFYPE